MRVSFAQHFEDVWLWRAFGHLAGGFYVDVGAFDPEEDSVTKIFYDSGWSGINMEPGARFPRFEAMRPDDTNLNIAASDHEGEVLFCDRLDAPGQSAVVDDSDPNTPSTRRVPCATLASVLATTAVGRHIHFLKIDAEGHEARVVAGNDWSLHRPELLIVEATAPGTTVPSHESWEPILISSDYLFSYFDGINRFYVRDESRPLQEVFAVPVSPLDGFVRSHPAAERALSRLRDRNRELEQERSVLLEDLIAPPGSRALDMGLKVARSTRGAYWATQRRRADLSGWARRVAETPSQLRSGASRRSHRPGRGSSVSLVSAPSILIDVTHMATTTVRTGIQRVVHSICGQWPDPEKVGFIVFGEDETAQLLGRSGRARLVESFHHGDWTGPRVDDSMPIRLSLADLSTRVVVCPELCTEPFRLRAYRQLLEKCPETVYFIVYDLIPWRFPHLYPREFTEAFSEYLALVADAPNIAFISGGVRTQFVAEVSRSETPNFVTVALGSDGLGMLPPPEFPRPRRFTVLGTVEPRKNHGLVLDAYDQLKPIYADLELLVVGPPGWAPRHLLDDLERRSSLGQGFTWHTNADDQLVRDAIRSSRATLYPSLVEGYGLPIVESLALGIPVIAPLDLPAAESVKGQGIIALDRLDARDLMHTMELALNDNFLRGKTDEISALELPTWSEFGASFAGWVSESAQSAR